MEKSESIKNLIESLINFQMNYTAPTKDNKGQIGSKEYWYVSLDSLIDCIRPQLTEVGLVFMQHLDNNNLTTYLCHSSGEYIMSSTPIVFNAARITRDGRELTSEVQNMGGGITYMKRYALSAILGISIDQDDDGAQKQTQPRAQVQQVVTQKATPPPRVRKASDKQEARLRMAGKQLREVNAEKAEDLSAQIAQHKKNGVWDSRLCSSYIEKIEEAYEETINSFT